MKGQLQYAIISYCPRLTDPDASSTPIAMVGLSLDPEAVFLAVRSKPERLAEDPLSKQVLSHLGSFLYEMVNEGFEQVSKEELLFWVHENLRNSVFVSEINRDVLFKPKKPIEIITTFLDILKSKVADNSEIPSIEIKPLSRQHDVEEDSYEYA